MYTAEQLVLCPSHLEVKVAISKLKKYKSSGSDQISAGMIQTGGESLVYAIHKLINTSWN
jgi:hypothetical protein